MRRHLLRRRWAAVSLGCTLFLVATSASANQDPPALARAYLAALKGGAWHEATAMMDPRELRQVHSFVVPVLKKLIRTRRRWPPPFSQLLNGLKTPAEVDRLTPDDVFIRLLKGSMASLDRSGTPFSKGQFTIIGQVRETPVLVHVVYRAVFRVRDIPVRSLAVISVARHQGQWRVKLNESMRQVAAAFRRLAKRL